MESPKEKEAFSVVKRAESFAHAGRGIRVFVASTHNSWIHITLACIAIILGFYFSISSIEWLFIIIAIGTTLAAEAFNTAIEIDIDLTSPEYHPFARDTKDVAAGAVLISSTVSLIIGLIIFSPKIIALVK